MLPETVREHELLWVAPRAAGARRYEVARLSPIDREALAKQLRLREGFGQGRGFSDALLAAVRSFTDAERVNSIVVFTDGFDTGAFDVESLATALKAAHRDHGVRMFPVGFGRAGPGSPACAALNAVATASHTAAECIGGNEATMTEQIKTVVRLMRSL